MRIKFLNEGVRKSFFKFVKEKYGKTWREIAKDFSVSRQSLDRYKSGQILLPEELFLDLVKNLDESGRQKISQDIEKFPDNFGQIKGGKNAYSVNFKKFEDGRKKGLISLQKSRKKRGRKIKEYIFSLDLSPDICEVIGAFIGDGFFNCYNNKLYQVEFAGDSRYDLDYYIKKIIPVIKRSFPDINPHIYKVKDKNAIRVVFYSKKLFCYIKDVFGFVPGKKTYIISIPKIILDEELFIYPTIRGIFDTDGGVYFDKRKGYKKPYPRIVFQTASKNLYSQLLPILSRDFKVYYRYNEKRRIYIIEIYGHNNLKKWMSLIGFSNKRHFDKIAPVAQFWF